MAFFPQIVIGTSTYNGLKTMGDYILTTSPTGLPYTLHLRANTTPKRTFASYERKFEEAAPPINGVPQPAYVTSIKTIITSTRPDANVALVKATLAEGNTFFQAGDNLNRLLRNEI